MSRASVHFIVTSHRRRVQPWRPRLQNAHRRILAEAQPLQLLHLLAWRVNGKQYAPCSSPLRRQLSIKMPFSRGGFAHRRTPL